MSDTTSMRLISDRVKVLPESQTIKMAQLSRELKAKGLDVVDLSLGEPDFNVPEHIKSAAKDAIDQDYSHYPPVPGYLDLRETIVKKFKRDSNLDFNPNQIVVSTGAKQSLANVILAIVNPGDEVVVPAPYWVTYAAQIKMAEGVMININADVTNDYKITPVQLDAALSENTKVFLFSSPCNPTGSVYTRDELKELAGVFEKYPQVTIISDEIYEYIVFDGEHVSIAEFGDLINRTVIINGLSKGFAMTGYRLGYIAAPIDIAAACAKIQSQFTSGANSIAQRAAITALSGSLDKPKEFTKTLETRKNYVLERLLKISDFKSHNPGGAFYHFPDISACFGKSHNGTVIEDADSFAMTLLLSKNLALVTGEAFGAPNCLRISYATSLTVLEKAMNLLHEFVNELK